MQEILKLNIYHGFLIQILIAEYLFVRILPRRKNSWLFHALALIGYIAGAVVIPNITARYVHGIFSAVIFLLSIFYWRLCAEGEWYEIIFCCTGALLMQNLSSNLEKMCINFLPFSVGLTASFFVSVGIMFATYIAIYKIFLVDFFRNKLENLNRKAVIVFLTLNLAFAFGMQYSFMLYGLESYWITKIPIIICDVLGLCVVFGLIELRTKAEDNRILMLMLEKERSQFEMTKKDMELIDIKAHDLKHFVQQFQAGRLQGEKALNEIEDALLEYQAVSRSGSAALDIILTEKRLLCNQEKIHLSSIADGTLLAFIEPADIASIFGNTLDNAVEYERSYVEEGKRCIFLKVVKKNCFVCISIENYCRDFPELIDGFPETVKENRDFHGYGLRSVAYVVNKYGGSFQIVPSGNMFAVRIIFPLEDNG